jgi:hypothetical protein
MEKRLLRLELVVNRRHPRRPSPSPRLDLSDLSVDERCELYDLMDRSRTAAEEMRHRELSSRVTIQETS